MADEIPGVVNSGLYRTTDRDAAMRQHARRQHQLRHAARLGYLDGRAGTTPYGDLDADDSPLMTALGETSPTTEDNHLRRLALLAAYRDAYANAARNAQGNITG